MNQFQLKVIKGHETIRRLTIAEISIDGTPFIEMVKLCEMPFAEKEGKPQLAGSYCYLPAYETFFPSRNFLGEGNALLQHGLKTTILVCECTTAGCRPFVCKITATPSTIIWSDFEQIFRHRKWDYTGLGPFFFDRTLYEKELKFPA